MNESSKKDQESCDENCDLMKDDMKIDQLFKFKELFSSKLSQCILITIAKLQKSHNDII